MEEYKDFNNSKGNKLSAILVAPNNDYNDTPVVVLCHGFSSNKNTTNFVKLADILLRNNIASFRFDIFGHGDSEGNFEDITVTEACEDILQAIEYLKKQGFGKIGLVGSSFGGIASIMAASQINDLFVLVLKSPVSNYVELETGRKSPEELERWEQDGYIEYEKSDGRKLQLNYSFMEDAYKNDGYMAAEKITAPTFIVHGGADETVPVEQSRKTASIIKNCILEIVEGANHRYTEPEHSQRMLQLISDFIINHAR